jgi:hypothetical protein
MKKQRRRVRPKRPMWHFAVRLKPADRELWKEAAMRSGESYSEVLRVALREHCRKLLLRDAGDRTAA